MDSRTLFLTLLYSCSSLPGTQSSKPLELNPERVVVEYGGSVSVNCSTQGEDVYLRFEADHNPVDNIKAKKITWNPKNVTKWGTKATCYSTPIPDGWQYLKKLKVVLYKRPDRVSVSVLNSNRTLNEGQPYELRCDVQDVAPVNLLTVIWYRGGAVLKKTTFNDRNDVKPVNVSDTLMINPSRSNDGIEFRCETVQELGPEGPQPPPTVTSQSISFNVHPTSGASELRSWSSFLIPFSRVETGLLVLSHCELLLFTLIVGGICNSMM